MSLSPRFIRSQPHWQRCQCRICRPGAVRPLLFLLPRERERYGIPPPSVRPASADELAPVEGQPAEVFPLSDRELAERRAMATPLSRTIERRVAALLYPDLEDPEEEWGSGI